MVESENQKAEARNRANKWWKPRTETHRSNSNKPSDFSSIITIIIHPITLFHYKLCPNNIGVMLGYKPKS